MRFTDRLARHVVRAYQAGISIPDAVSELGLDARHQVEEWFKQDHGLGEVAFLLAAAVLNGCTYMTVSAHADRIEKNLADITGLTPSPQPAARARSERLATALARLEDKLLITEYGASVSETVTMESASLIPAVLDVVWHEYDLIAKALMDWILEAGCDRDPAVRIRVACAAGQLAEYDFATIRSRLFLPWAKDDRANPGWTAAIALGVPASKDTTASLVLRLLHHWATLNNTKLAWTAIVAYGGYVGMMYPHIAMSELLNIATRIPSRQALVAGSLRRLFLLGGKQDPATAAVVLAGLADWVSNEPAPAPHLARAVFAGLLETAGRPEQWDARAVWEQLTEEMVRDRSALLLSRCLDNDDVRKTTLDAIRDLLAIADTDNDVYRALEQLVLAAVAASHARSRSARRIQEYLTRWAAGPKSSPSASRMLAMIRKEAAT
jgi:hypothetical protein